MSPGGVSSSASSSVAGRSLRLLRPWYSESGSLSAGAKGSNGEVSGGSTTRLRGSGLKIDSRGPGGTTGLNGGVQAAVS